MKRIVILLLLTLAIAAFGIWLSFREVLLPVDELAVSKPEVTPPAALRIRPLLNGALLSRAGMAFRGGRFDDEREFTIGGLLIEHPEGTLLVDAGFGEDVAGHVELLPRMMQRSTRYRLDEPMKEALAGRMPDAVLLTHAHWDHVSGLDGLGEVPVLVAPGEARFIQEGGQWSEHARRFIAGDLETIAFDDGPWLGFATSHDHFGDGSVVSVPASGHTPGSIIVFVTLASGEILALIGDIAWQLEGVEKPVERPWLMRLMVDDVPADVRGHLSHLHALAKALPEIVIVPAHDPRAWARVAQLASSQPAG